MAGLLAWAADVVGGGQINEDDDSNDSIPLIFTLEQQQYARELDQKSASLSRLIQDLRLRLPPPDISQRLPHLHAHSLASNAALTLQLNAHSATKEQAQLREVTLQEENVAYEKAISDCENKIQEKLQEADQLRIKLEEMELAERKLTSELENAQLLDESQSGNSNELLLEFKSIVDDQVNSEASLYELQEKLTNKKKETASMEEVVEGLERKWSQLQDNLLKQPSPAQREKILDKQLHSLMEQLAAKQAQAEGLVGEIHLKEMELERLSGLWRKVETSTAELNAARNRFGRSNSDKGYLSSDYIVDPRYKPQTIGRIETLERQMLLRSAFVLYILALNILVFLKISF